MSHNSSLLPIRSVDHPPSSSSSSLRVSPMGGRVTRDARPIGLESNRTSSRSRIPSFIARERVDRSPLVRRSIARARMSPSSSALKPSAAFACERVARSSSRARIGVRCRAIARASGVLAPNARAGKEYDELANLLRDFSYSYKVGDKVKGKVIACDSKGALVEIGAKADALVPTAECSLSAIKNVRRAYECCAATWFFVVTARARFRA